MIRPFGIFSLSVLLVAAIPAARADDAQILQELRDLRTVVELQSKQIDALTMQVARLNQYLGARFGAVPTTSAASAPGDPPRAEPVEKTEPVEEGQRHIIVKGDNLTSIAKHYNVPLSELQKANKNVNPARLQIGQSIIIPATKAPEQPSEKKDQP